MKKILILLFLGTLVWAITTPNYVRSGPAHRNDCVSHLKHLEGAKELWAAEHKIGSGAKVEWTNLVPDYIRTAPVCLDDGTYTLGAIGSNPTCTVKGHVLP